MCVLYIGENGSKYIWKFSYIHTYTHTHTHTHTHIYIYIYRERERERERKNLSLLLKLAKWFDIKLIWYTYLVDLGDYFNI